MGNRSIDLERIIDGTGLLFYIADLDGKIVYISKSGADSLGVEKPDLIGKDIFDYFQPGVSERRRSILSNIFQTKQQLSFFDEREGRFFKTMAYPVFDGKGQLQRIAAYVQDLTEIKAAEKKIEELKNEMERTIKGSPAHVFRFRKDDRGTIIAVLSEGCIADRFGINTKAIKGRNLLELFGEESFKRLHPFYEKAFSGEHVSFDISLRGTWFQTTIAPFTQDENGVVQEVIGYSMDTTMVKKTQKELERAEKLESLGTLAGGIAHDFNNLLGGLFGFIDLARAAIQHDVSAREYIDSAMQCFSRAKDLTQQLLTFSKGGAPHKTVVSLEPLFRESIKLSLSGSAIRCEMDLQRELHSIEADHGQINQVFNNILLNARQAMPNGGVIRIEAGNRVLHVNEIADLSAGEYVHIRFADQGMGIPKDVLPKVFDPFYTTKKAGSGLGLATSYSIIKRHDGHIDLESESGKGTAVNIFLPTAHDFPGTESEEPQSVSVVARGRILIMDDEDVICKVASEMLKGTGYEVVCVKSGEKAIEEYAAAIAQGSTFDVVILDLTVIAGMGGEKAVRRLLEIDPDLKAIVSSGYSDSPVLADPAKYGFSGKIAKPYQRNDLLTAVSEVVRNKRGAG